MKGKVLTRIQNITELQNVLGKCLAGAYENICMFWACTSCEVKGIGLNIKEGIVW